MLNFVLDWFLLRRIAMVRKSERIRQIEEKYHRPIEKLLKEMYNEEKKTLPAMAEELGVSRSTVYYWMLKSGFELKRMALTSDETLEVKKGR